MHPANASRADPSDLKLLSMEIGEWPLWGRRLCPLRAYANCSAGGNNGRNILNQPRCFMKGASECEDEGPLPLMAAQIFGNRVSDEI